MNDIPTVVFIFVFNTMLRETKRLFALHASQNLSFIYAFLSEKCAVNMKFLL